MTVKAIQEAMRSGARLAPCCELIGISARTCQRWLAQGSDGGIDRRRGPKTKPHNKLREEERRKIIKYAVSGEFCDLTPHQIVPTLAERGIYVGSESSFYRVLRQERKNAKRGRKKPPAKRAKREHLATGPGQVWSWDITYLKTPVRGIYYYLYMFVDVWSRKIVGWTVSERQSADEAASLVESIFAVERVNSETLVLHSDNGGPMVGYAMVSKLEALGVAQSLSRPQVSDDNAYSESLFATLKGVPHYPDAPFKDLDEARRWVEAFVCWYNTEHKHSGIAFVTPEQRHNGEQEAILRLRERTYNAAKKKHPERWSGDTRKWERHNKVFLNNSRPKEAALA